jgi:hypothetical protein
MRSDKTVREELLALLRGGNAHMSFDSAVSGFPMEDVNKQVPQGTYKVWHLVDHMRIAQWDILEFVRDPGHVSPDFPDGYWPRSDETATPAKWNKIVKAFQADLKAVQAIVSDPKTDLFSPMPHAKEYTVFREMLLVADHNAYHVGELVSLRRVLNMKPIKEY